MINAAGYARQRNATAKTRCKRDDGVNWRLRAMLVSERRRVERRRKRKAEQHGMRRFRE